MEYTVIVHEAEEGGYWVDVPVLPGCYSQGETIEEAMKNVEEAIEVHLEGMKTSMINTGGRSVPIDVIKDGVHIRLN